jgi:hypothetical protein
MGRSVRSLFCALLAVLVAMLVAPEPLAHAAMHIDNHVSASGFDHPRTDHAPSKPCGDCCHHATCHMKVTPASQAWSRAFDLQAVRFRAIEFVAPYGAPATREPDPERS